MISGIYGDELENIQKIIEYYNIYDGDQKWDTPDGLDYKPTKKITNYIKKLINTKARFMFGKEPFLDLRPLEIGEIHDQKTQEKEDLLHDILRNNKFHSKLLKAKKDCSIGGKIAIKLWAREDKGLKIVFSPAQEFFTRYNIDDIDELEMVSFVYQLEDADSVKDQRFKKQSFEMIEGSCILNEGVYDGDGKVVSMEFTNHNTGLDFIPVVIVINGGLTGETEGGSDVKELLDNQMTYNRLTSDDVDALRFQMFGQDVITDADVSSLESIVIAPGAMIDLQTDLMQQDQGRQASMDRLESGFSYSDKYKDTINRIVNDMYDIMDVPNVSLDQLKGLMTSGKSMQALYWGLIAVCEEEATEWEPAIEQMVYFIFRMVDIYNLYGARSIAQYETSLEIIRSYPLPEDIDNQKSMDMDEVIATLRSRKSYINKWSNVEDVEEELDQIISEKSMFNDSMMNDYVDQMAEIE